MQMSGGTRDMAGNEAVSEAGLAPKGLPRSHSKKLGSSPEGSLLTFSRGETTAGI